MTHSERKYYFKKYDLVFGKNLRAGDSYVTFIGIVNESTEDKVSLVVVWCEYMEKLGCKPWFIGNEIEFFAAQSYCWNNIQFYGNVKHIGDASFPWDIPGHYPVGGVCFESGRIAFENAKANSKIADRKQFQDLLTYVKYNVNINNKDIGIAVIDFYKEFGWSDYGNMFIQGVHADGREWNDPNIKKTAQPILFI